MRRRLAAVSLVALCVPALAFASHREPRQQLTAADQRKAASIVLKRSDFVAGWAKTPSTPEDGSHLSCPGYDPNGADLVLTGEAEADFERSGGFPAVYSFVNVFKTRAQAASSWTRTVKPALPACLTKVFADGMASEGHRATVTRSGTIAFPKLSPRTAAFRVAMSLSVTENGRTTKLPLTMYVIALGHGRGEAGIMTLGFGDSTRLEDVRVLARATAQRLAAARL